SLEIVPEQEQATRRRFLGVIQEECDRMAHLLGDVSDLSRIEGGECTLRLTALSLDELGRWTHERMAPLAAARGVRIDLHADDARVEVDLELMRRALENLVQNAIDASPEGGTVRLTLT